MVIILTLDKKTALLTGLYLFHHLLYHEKVKAALSFPADGFNRFWFFVLRNWSSLKDHFFVPLFKKKIV